MILLSDVRRRVLGDLIIDGELTIVETLTTEQLVVTNVNTGPGILINQTGLHPIAEFQSNGSTTLLVKGDKVGIGTYSPSANLHIVGTVKIGSASGILHSTDGLISASLIYDSDIATGAAIDWSKVSKVGSSINDIGAPSSDYSLAGNKLTDLKNPTEDQDAATRRFVEETLATKTLASLADAAVDSLAASQLLVSNDQGKWTNKSISGAILIDQDGVVTFASGSISNESISDYASISLSKLQSLANGKAIVSDAYGVIASSEVTSAELANLIGTVAPIQAQIDSKQPIGDYLTSLSGDVVSSSSGEALIADEVVTSKLLTGLVSSPGEVTSTDSLLSAVGKLSAATHSALTLGTTNGLTLVNQQLSLAAASASTTGALLVTDWNTFNNKEPGIVTLPISKGGTNNSTLDVSSGNLIYADGVKLTSLSLGVEGQYLSVSSGNLTWQDLPLAKSYNDSTRPSPDAVVAGSIIFNTDDNTLNVSDGYNWRDMAGSVT